MNNRIILISTVFISVFIPYVYGGSNVAWVANATGKEASCEIYVEHTDSLAIAIEKFRFFQHKLLHDQSRQKRKEHSEYYGMFDGKAKEKWRVNNLAVGNTSVVCEIDGKQHNWDLGVINRSFYILMNSKHDISWESLEHFKDKTKKFNTIQRSEY